MYQCLEVPYNLMNQYSSYDQCTVLQNPAGLGDLLNRFFNIMENKKFINAIFHSTQLNLKTFENSGIVPRKKYS